jgi:hypothetical protein
VDSLTENVRLLIASFCAEITTSETLIAPTEIAPSLEGSRLVDDLIRLQELYDQGILNEQGFNSAKMRLLGL